jgi:gliding motility-associated-like protein
VVNAGPDKVVLEGGEIRLAATASGNNLRFLWTPAQFLNGPTTLNPLVVSPNSDMTYRLTVTGLGGCVSTDDVFVKLLKAPVIPNTFTPNEDGINDFWIIQYIESYPNARVQIFNRYGQQVFESRGYDKPWDGNYKGKPLPFGTYYYVIEPGSGRKPYTGYVTIVK